MNRFSSELKELKKLVKNPVGGGGNRRVGQGTWRLKDVFDDIIPPLGEGRILNELASCKNSGEGGLGEVYNVLEEVSGIAQGTTEFCFPKESKTYPNPVLQKEGTRESRHAELDSASHDIPSPVLRTPSAWLLAKNGNSAFCRRASGSL